MNSERITAVLFGAGLLAGACLNLSFFALAYLLLLLLHVPLGLLPAFEAQPATSSGLVALAAACVAVSAVAVLAVDGAGDLDGNSEAGHDWADALRGGPRWRHNGVGAAARAFAPHAIVVACAALRCAFIGRSRAAGESPSATQGDSAPLPANDLARRARRAAVTARVVCVAAVVSTAACACAWPALLTLPLMLSVLRVVAAVGLEDTRACHHRCRLLARALPPYTAALLVLWSLSQVGLVRDAMGTVFGRGVGSGPAGWSCVTGWHLLGVPRMDAPGAASAVPPRGPRSGAAADCAPLPPQLLGPAAAAAGGSSGPGIVAQALAGAQWRAPVAAATALLSYAMWLALGAALAAEQRAGAEAASSQPPSPSRRQHLRDAQQPLHRARADALTYAGTGGAAAIALVMSFPAWHTLPLLLWALGGACEFADGRQAVWRASTALLRAARRRERRGGEAERQWWVQWWGLRAAAGGTGGTGMRIAVLIGTWAIPLAGVLLRFLCSFTGAPLTLVLAQPASAASIARAQFTDELLWLRSHGLAPLARPMSGLLLQLALLLALGASRRAAAAALRRWHAALGSTASPPRGGHTAAQGTGDDDAAVPLLGADAALREADSEICTIPDAATGSQGEMHGTREHPDAREHQHAARDTDAPTFVLLHFCPLVLLLSLAISARVCAINAFYLVCAVAFGASRRLRVSATHRLVLVGGGALIVALLFTINLVPDCALRHSALPRFDPTANASALVPPTAWDEVTGLLVLRPFPPKPLQSPLPLAWAEETLWPTDMVLGILMFLLAVAFAALVPDGGDAGVSRGSEHVPASMRRLSPTAETPAAPLVPPKRSDWARAWSNARLGGTRVARVVSREVQVRGLSLWACYAAFLLLALYGEVSPAALNKPIPAQANGGADTTMRPAGGASLVGFVQLTAVLVAGWRQLAHKRGGEGGRNTPRATPNQLRYSGLLLGDDGELLSSRELRYEQRLRLWRNARQREWLALKPVWAVLLVFDVVVLVLRYIYQMPALHRALATDWPGGEVSRSIAERARTLWLPLPELGLVYYARDSTAGVGDARLSLTLRVGLLPLAACTVLAAAQWYVWSTAPHVDPWATWVATDRPKARRARTAIGTDLMASSGVQLRRVWTAVVPWMPLLLIVAVVACALWYPPSAMGLALLLPPLSSLGPRMFSKCCVCCWCCGSKGRDSARNAGSALAQQAMLHRAGSWKRVWGPLYCVSSASALLLYVFQLSPFAPPPPSPTCGPGECLVWWCDGSAFAAWVGVRRALGLDEDGNGDALSAGALCDVMLPQLVTIAICVIARHVRDNDSTRADVQESSIEPNVVDNGRTRQPREVQALEVLLIPTNTPVALPLTAAVALLSVAAVAHANVIGVIYLLLIASLLLPFPVSLCRPGAESARRSAPSSSWSVLRLSTPRGFSWLGVLPLSLVWCIVIFQYALMLQPPALEAAPSDSSSLSLLLQHVWPWSVLRDCMCSSPPNNVTAGDAGWALASHEALPQCFGMAWWLALSFVGGRSGAALRCDDAAYPYYGSSFERAFVNKSGAAAPAPTPALLSRPWLPQAPVRVNSVLLYDVAALVALTFLAAVSQDTAQRSQKAQHSGGSTHAGADTIPFLSTRPLLALPIANGTPSIGASGARAAAQVARERAALGGMLASIASLAARCGLVSACLVAGLAAGSSSLFGVLYLSLGMNLLFVFAHGTAAFTQRRPASVGRETTFDSFSNFVSEGGGAPMGAEESAEAMRLRDQQRTRCAVAWLAVWAWVSLVALLIFQLPGFGHAPAAGVDCVVGTSTQNGSCLSAQMLVGFRKVPLDGQYPGSPGTAVPDTAVTSFHGSSVSLTPLAAAACVLSLAVLVWVMDECVVAYDALRQGVVRATQHVFGTDTNTNTNTMWSGADAERIIAKLAKQEVINSNRTAAARWVWLALSRRRALERLRTTVDAVETALDFSTTAQDKPWGGASSDNVVASFYRDTTRPTTSPLSVLQHGAFARLGACCALVSWHSAAIAASDRNHAEALLVHSFRILRVALPEEGEDDASSDRTSAENVPSQQLFTEAGSSITVAVGDARQGAELWCEKVAGVTPAGLCCCLVGGLQPGRRYTFRIAAIGLLGESEMSEFAPPMRTEPLPAPGQPHLSAQTQGFAWVQRRVVGTQQIAFAQCLRSVYAPTLTVLSTCFSRVRRRPRSRTRLATPRSSSPQTQTGQPDLIRTARRARKVLQQARENADGDACYMQVVAPHGSEHERHWLLMLREPVAPDVRVFVQADGTLGSAPLLHGAGTGNDLSEATDSSFIACRASVRDAIAIGDVLALALSAGDEVRFGGGGNLSQRERDHLVGATVAVRLWARAGRWTTRPSVLRDDALLNDTGDAEGDTAASATRSWGQHGSIVEYTVTFDDLKVDSTSGICAWIAALAQSFCTATPVGAGDGEHETAHMRWLHAIGVLDMGDGCAPTLAEQAQRQRLHGSRVVISNGVRAILNIVGDHSVVDSPQTDTAPQRSLATAEAGGVEAEGRPRPPPAGLDEDEGGHRGQLAPIYVQQSFDHCLVHARAAPPVALIARFFGRRAALHALTARARRQRERERRQHQAAGISVVSCQGVGTDSDSGSDDNAMPAPPPATLYNWVQLLACVVTSCTQHILGLVLVLAFAVQLPHGGAVAAFYPLAWFAVFMPDSHARHVTDIAPHHALRWRALSSWASFVIALKFIFLLPLWCYVVNSSGAANATGVDARGSSVVYSLSVQPHCPQAIALSEQSDCAQCQVAVVQPLALTGVMYPPPAVLANNPGGNPDYLPAPLQACAWDIAVLLATLFHCWALRCAHGSHVAGQGEHDTSEGSAGPGSIHEPPAPVRAVPVSQRVREWWKRLCPPAPPAEWPDVVLSDTRSGRAGRGAESSTSSRDAWRTKPGTSWDAPIISVLLVCLLFTFFFFGTISAASSSGGSSDATTTAATARGSRQTLFTAQTVYVMLAQIALIVMERTVQLRRNVHAKVVLQAVVALLLHVVVLFVLPLYAGEYFQQRPDIVVFYLLHCIYLWFSALQIRDGYMPFDDALGMTGGTAAQRGYGKLPYYSFMAFFYCPFLFELKGLLDWCNKPTSLDVFMFLQVEEMYADLYMVRCNMQYRRADALVLRGHRKQPAMRKLIYGALIFGVLVFVLLAPIVLFSAINPALSANPVRSAEATLTLVNEDGGQRYTVFSTRDLSLSTPPSELSNAGNDGLVYGGGTSTGAAAAPGTAEPGDVAAQQDLNLPFTPALLSALPSRGLSKQFVQFRPFGSMLWGITPPARANLLEALEAPAGPSGGIRWELSFAFSRVGPPEGKTIRWTASRRMPQGGRAALAAVLNATASSNNSSAKVTVPVRGLYFPLLYLVPEGQPLFSDVDGVARNTSATLTVDGEREYWNLAAADSGTPNPARKPKVDCAALAGQVSPKQRYFGGVCMLLLSPGYQPVTSFLGLVNSSIAALYIFVLFTIGRYVRLVFMGYATAVIYTEMADTGLLLGLCDGIRIAREESYHGHLKDEVRLFETLLKLYRSPETLLRLTGDRTIHLPPLRRHGATRADKLKLD